MAKLCKFFSWKKNEVSVEKVRPIGDCERSKSMGVIGLYNLGSTCYFNSALQNLLYLRPFREQLYHTMTRTEYKLVPKKQPDLGTLKFSYSDKKSEPEILTREIFYLINETNSQSEETEKSHGKKTLKKFVITPRAVHNQIARKHKKFSKGSQQDSHELFRSLIDMVKDEEIKRLKVAFFDHFNINGHKPHIKNYPEVISKEKLLRYANEFDNIFVFTGTFIDDTFGGEMIDTVKCLGCGNIFDRSEDFLDISLPLPAESEEVNAFSKNDIIPSHNQPQSEVESNSENEGAVKSKELKRLNDPKDYPEGSLEYYLMRYFSPKFLEKDYVCNVCNPQLVSKQDKHSNSDGDKNEKEDSTESINIDNLTFTDACKQFHIKTLTPVLAIHLNRFSQTGYGLQKLNKRVEFPLVLDMSPFCVSDTSVPKDCNNQILYGLRGIVDHTGWMGEGHYMAYVNIADWNKPSKIPSKDNAKSCKIGVNGEETTTTIEPMDTGPAQEWYFISDYHWFRTDRHHVLSSQAYILFYERLPLVAKDTHR